MTSLHAVGAILLVFAGVKLAIAWTAIRRRRAFRAGTGPEPQDGHARPWLFWAWVGWRIAAAALALAVGAWLLLR